MEKDMSFAVISTMARTVDDESSATKLLVDPKSAKRAGTQDIIELAREVQRADEEVRHVASGKLQVIAEQIKFLQQQARQILEDAKMSSQLHNAKCNFVKKPGNIYYLYERESGTTYFSMLSPAEWSNCPHVYIGAYRLEHDRSWTKLEDVEKRDNDQQLIDKIMSIGGIPSLEYTTSTMSNSKNQEN